MKKTAAAAAAAAAVAIATASGAFAAGRAPALRVLDRDPLVVRGESFRPGERVVVTAFTGLGPRSVRTTARGGVFRVAFRLPDQPCAGARAVRARGSLGSTATLRLAPAGACVPPPRD